MSRQVWADLLKRAGEKGADLVQFEVNLQRFMAGPDPGTGLNMSWCARAGKNVGTGTPNQSENVTMLTRFGCTGEEALRRLVEGLESEKTK